MTLESAQIFASNHDDCQIEVILESAQIFASNHADCQIEVLQKSDLSQRIHHTHCIPVFKMVMKFSEVFCRETCADSSIS